ncbi:GNAT family N-acetyltransferase [Sphaerisporangium sp. NPDC051017]|uniref:GNAT family N-acetyltransferase n=1 Tax=Sphaerisporangium sp. NPDC051017 TaxID=3154636 RepID=UPI00342CF961
MHPLDNPAWASLTGPHAHFAERRGNALRYPAEVSPFVALPTTPEVADWEDMAALAGPGGLVPFAAVAATPPDGWEVVDSLDGVQLSGEDVTGRPDPEAVVLGPGDVPDMLALVARTKPGPFAPRTFEMGTYLGIRRDGVLVAMAGERLHPPGWTEVSAVCTDEAFRGQGLGSRLVLAVAAGIRSRGEIPFLHAASFNTTAIRLYQALGFRLRRPAMFPAVRVPADVPVA